ncbi:hypothetical protein GCM10010399_27190 [Dactylosporangium fulvum]|uniref:Uncharacterized protein n=1 Tax=Dactylosporangium fulvum TaxID=53359 RepID=A0ABY5VSM6_9ACTN|nr:hypothetical protein [Dactylosporangium fulvum]UWP80106.1 hypothetical protein Dfulv_33765 [Dactylosporangium fulvum]
MRRLIGAATAAVVGAALALLQGCGLLTEHASVSALTWSPDGYVYFVHNVGEAVGEVWRVRQGQRAEAFVPTFPGACGSDTASVDVLQAFGATGLAVGLWCPLSTDQLYTMDLRTRVASIRLSAEDVRGVTLDASGLRGYVAQHDGNCASVLRFSDGAVHDTGARVASLGGEWRLSEAYGMSARDGGNQGCPGTGRAVSPALTADGRTVAMLVSTQPGPGGVNAPLSMLYYWKVGFLDAAGDTVSLIGPLLRGVTHIAVSPDGSKVALIHSGDEDGLSVMDTASGATRQVTTKGWVGDAAFSPDGRTIAYSSDGTSIKFVQVP